MEPWWNRRGTLPQSRPEPPRSLSGLRPQSFQLLGNKDCMKIAPKDDVHTVLNSNDPPLGTAAGRTGSQRLTFSRLFCSALRYSIKSHMRVKDIDPLSGVHCLRNSHLKSDSQPSKENDIHCIRQIARVATPCASRCKATSGMTSTR